MKSQLLFLVVIGLFVLLLPLQGRSQQAGRLDPSFGVAGEVNTHLFDSTLLYDMAIQPDKKIVVVGQTFDPTDVQLVAVVARFNENGSLDLTFDSDGYNNQLLIKQLAAVRILSDGKILVGGYNTDGISHRFVVARLNSNGSLDANFGTGGISETTVGGLSEITSLQVLSDGKIIASGSTKLSGSTQKDFAMVRYNSDGSLDTTFGSNGRVATDISGSDDVSVSSAIQPDGKILLSGYYIDPLPNQKVAVVIRYSADGVMDSGFAGTGKISRAGGPGASADKIAVQSDGKIILVGNDISPARYSSNGTLDITFPIPSGQFAEAVAIQSDGKIVMTGTGFVARFNVEGSLDPTFGTGGVATSSFYATLIAIAPDRKIVIGGGFSQFTVHLARYLNNEIPMDFDGDGKTDISIFRPARITGAEWWYARSSDGIVLANQFGSPTDVVATGDFTGDGKSDIAVWRPSTGQWFVLRSEDNSFLAFPFGANGDMPMPADYDGDGKTDAAVFRPSNSTWFISPSNGGATIISQFGVAGDLPVAADYDGDGKADIGIIRQNGGNTEWWIQRSTAGLFATVFGVNGDRAVPGDYTGDGKADIAVWRPSNGNWFILRSEDLSYLAFPWGTNGDMPAPGDYDGDGKTDAAVYRPTSATWYVNRTGGQGPLIVGFGGPSDQPVPGAYVR